MTSPNHDPNPSNRDSAGSGPPQQPSGSFAAWQMFTHRSQREGSQPVSRISCPDQAQYIFRTLIEQSALTPLSQSATTTLVAQQGNAISEAIFNLSKINKGRAEEFEYVSTLHAAAHDPKHPESVYLLLGLRQRGTDNYNVPTRFGPIPLDDGVFTGVWAKLTKDSDSYANEKHTLRMQPVFSSLITPAIIKAVGEMTITPSLFFIGLTLVNEANDQGKKNPRIFAFPVERATHPAVVVSSGEHEYCQVQIQNAPTDDASLPLMQRLPFSREINWKTLEALRQQNTPSSETFAAALGKYGYREISQGERNSEEFARYLEIISSKLRSSYWESSDAAGTPEVRIESVFYNERIDPPLLMRVSFRDAQNRCLALSEHSALFEVLPGEASVVCGGDLVSGHIERHGIFFDSVALSAAMMRLIKSPSSSVLGERLIELCRDTFDELSALPRSAEGLEVFVSKIERRNQWDIPAIPLLLRCSEGLVTGTLVQSNDIGFIPENDGLFLTSFFPSEQMRLVEP